MRSGADNRVVAGIDGSSSAVRAAVWAGAEAVRRGRPLRLVHVYAVPRGGLPGITGSRDRIRTGLTERAHTWLDEAEAAVLAASPGLLVEVAAREWDPVAALVQESERACLLVLGSRGLGGFTGLLMGSTAIALAGHGHCPVVVVRGEITTGTLPVTVGVDGSAHGDSAIGFACDEASMRGVGLRAVHAGNHTFTGQPTPHRLPAGDRAEIAQDHDSPLSRHLEVWREKYPDVAITASVWQGTAITVLLEYGRKSQLLVVGSRGLGGFAGMVLGSTSQALVEHAPCPIAIVRPHLAMVTGWRQRESTTD
ncbi:universal stress protein [Amycolatopsis minnesotensis]|uniref:Universal stress protein n=1 Tax=Amycolatopsis minnesotensis TaxID=337894 RepID=A0ABP5CK76_9PSEU